MIEVYTAATGHDDYKKPADMATWMQSQKASATATLMDSDGKTGRAVAQAVTRPCGCSVKYADG